MVDKTKIGIIGCGKIAERHIMAYRKLGVDVVVADAADDAAQRMAEQYELTSLAHPEDVFQDPGVAGVDVCVPTARHKEVILNALNHGKHIFCEKPLCQTSDEAREIQVAARESGSIVEVGFLQRFHPAFQFVKDALSDRIIGRPYFATFRVGGRGDDQPWKHQQEIGGGVILEMLVHKLDQIIWFFGPADRVEVLEYDTLRPKRTIRGQTVDADAEDLVVLEIEAGGVRILCQGDFITPSYMDHTEIQGENGSIFTSLLHFMPTIIHCKERRGIFNQGNNTYNFPMINLFEDELGGFVSRINGGPSTNGSSLEDSIHVMEIIDQIRKGSTRFARGHWDSQSDG